MNRTPCSCAGCPLSAHAVAGRKPRLCRHRLPLDGSDDGSRGAALHAHGLGKAPTGWAKAVSPTAGTCFQNIGDGTYFHSGLLAIRAAVASGVNITFEILYNDAVAMTGGQKPDGPLSVPQITRQVAAEGAVKVVVVSDDPAKYPPATVWPRGRTAPQGATRPGAAGFARGFGHQRAGLRPDLRRGKATSAQTRAVSGSASTDLHP